MNLGLRMKDVVTILNVGICYPQVIRKVMVPLLGLAKSQ